MQFSEEAKNFTFQSVHKLNATLADKGVLRRPRSVAAVRPRLGRSTHKQCHDSAAHCGQRPGSDGDPCLRTNRGFWG